LQFYSEMDSGPLIGQIREEMNCSSVI
jgi:hypothetical protein